MNDRQVSVNGVLPTALLVAFVVLKLCHIIAWSWLWVLAPLWIPFALAIVFLLMGALGISLWHAKGK